MQIQERRSAQRFPLALQGSAIIGGCKVGLRTRDISQSGALVEFAAPCPITEEMEVGIQLEIGFIAGAVVRRIIPQQGGAWYGMSFNRFDFHSDLLLSAYFVKNGHQPLSH